MAKKPTQRDFFSVAEIISGSPISTFPFFIGAEPLSFGWAHGNPEEKHSPASHLGEAMCPSLANEK